MRCGALGAYQHEGIGLVALFQDPDGKLRHSDPRCDRAMLLEAQERLEQKRLRQGLTRDGRRSPQLLDTVLERALRKLP